MTRVVILRAAGSLRGAFKPLLAHFYQQTGIAVETHFAPAGLLREQIEAGMPCSVFASANRQHPQALREAGLAGGCYSFARNQLMLTARSSVVNREDTWLTLLNNPRWRLATSTPGCDPAGDYSWQLFSRIEATFPGCGKAMMARAQQLVGGRQPHTIPPGETAGGWLIRQDLTDLFIGYAHYASQITSDFLSTLTIPSPWNIQADYQMTITEESSEAQQLCHFILSLPGQHYLQQAGFLPVNGK